jgi:hypothetical protein
MVTLQLFVIIIDLYQKPFCNHGLWVGLGDERVGADVTF